MRTSEENRKYTKLEYKTKSGEQKTVLFDDATGKFMNEQHKVATYIFNFLVNVADIVTWNKFK